MFVQSLKYPFEHTIIYDVFEDAQVTSLIKEAKSISEKYDHKAAIDLLKNDKTKHDEDKKHNVDVIKDHNTKVFELANVAPEGIIRNLCWNIPKLFFLNTIEKTYLTNYFYGLSRDRVFFQFYENGASYPSHRDLTTLSAVYIFYNDAKSIIKGGKFKFDDYNYEPYLLHNSCILFPGWAKHSVSELTCDANNFRISVYQAFCI